MLTSEASKETTTYYQDCEGSQILSYLQANAISCQFRDVSRRHETHGSETNDYFSW